MARAPCGSGGIYCHRPPLAYGTCARSVPRALDRKISHERSRGWLWTWIPKSRRSDLYTATRSHRVIQSPATMQSQAVRLAASTSCPLYPVRFSPPPFLSCRQYISYLHPPPVRRRLMSSNFRRRNPYIPSCQCDKALNGFNSMCQVRARIAKKLFQKGQPKCLSTRVNHSCPPPP